MAKIIYASRTPSLDRGGGVETVPLVTPSSVAGAKFTTGISTYPQGGGAPLHSHNCDEQVTLLEGDGEVEIEGVRTELNSLDSTYIPAGVVHAFRNRGGGPMRILWVYAGDRVTRTFAESGVTVEHLSGADRVGGP